MLEVYLRLPEVTVARRIELLNRASRGPLPRFAKAKLTERVHEALVKEHPATMLTGYINLNGAAVEAREKPVKTPLAATERMAGNIKREVREAKRKRIRV